MPLEIPLPRTADYAAPDTKALCEKLVPGGRAVYLGVDPIEGATENNCYLNVERAIQQNGGSIQYGWEIWETIPGVMIEAEFHAVWIDHYGLYRNVSPSSSPGITKILFLADPSSRYEGRQIDNVRIALKDDSLVHEFIQNAEALFRETNRGELETYHGEIKTTSAMRRLMRRNAELFVEMVQKFFQ